MSNEIIDDVVIIDTDGNTVDNPSPVIFTPEEIRKIMDEGK